MEKLFNTQVSKETKKLLASHGFIGFLESDRECGSGGVCEKDGDPRVSAITEWVGVDTSIGKMDGKKKMADVVNDYLKKERNLAEADVVWVLIESNETEYGEHYEIIEKDGAFNKHNYTFMFVRNEMSEVVNGKDIINAREKLMRSFERQVAEYEAWENGDVFSTVVTVSNYSDLAKSNLGKALAGAVLPVASDIDFHINEMIDAMVRAIDCAKKGVVTLDFSSNADTTSYTKPLSIIRGFEHAFGYTPALGTCENLVDGESNILRIKMSLDAMPTLSEIQNNISKSTLGESGFDLVKEIEKHSNELTKNERFNETLDVWSAINTLTADKPFSEWPSQLLYPLMMAMCAVATDMQLLHISHDCKRMESL